MGFLENLFRKEKKKESVILIDVGGDSVGGACVVYEEGAPPVIAYGKRVPVTVRENEQDEHAMLRSLDTLGEALLREGSPALARATGTGRAGGIGVAVGAPWQRSVLRVEHLEKAEPFEFTADLVREATKDDGGRAPGKLFIEEHLVGTVLNGYRTDDPVGRRVNRATLVIMASLIDERVARHVTADLRELFHAERFRILAGSGLRFEAVHAAFPHQEDALVLDATTEHPTVGLIRKGVPAVIEEVSRAAARHGWTSPMASALGGIASKFPLPKTVFLLSGAIPADLMRKTLSAPPVRKFWLTHEPPKIVPVEPGHLVSHVRLSAGVEPDLKLILMALYHQAGD